MNPSVIIPSLEGEPITKLSVPESVDVHVVMEGNRSEARNIGAERAEGDILVFCDDDIEFSESYFWTQVSSLSENELRGLIDFDFGLLLTRFMLIHRTDFERVGGFDNRLNHMEDTEFSLRCQTSGMTVTPLPRDDVFHHDHPNEIGTKERVVSLAFLLHRYPSSAPTLIRGMLR